MSTAQTIPTTQERALLDAARAGDEGAYRRVVEPHRTELHAHCYRMLGSVHDAEDALQDALTRAWRGLGRFEGRSSVRTWLYRIATNACLDMASRRAKRLLPVDYGPGGAAGEPLDEPLLESVWIEPYADGQLEIQDGLASPEARYERRESLELAFVAALQLLPPRQRAVLILREVLGFSAAEAAESLGLSVAAVNSALQRARLTLDERLPEQSQQTTLRELGDARVRELVAAYADAMERADVQAVLALLTEEATWSMPPMRVWYRGRKAVTWFLREYALSVDWRHVPTRANGQAAIGCYAWDAGRGRYVGGVIDVLTFDGPRIAEITAFIDSSVFPRFGLPVELPRQ